MITFSHARMFKDFWNVGHVFLSVGTFGAFNPIQIIGGHLT